MKKLFIILMLCGCSSSDAIRNLNVTKMASLENYNYNVAVLIAEISEAHRRQAYDQIDMAFYSSLKDSSNNGFIPLDIIESMLKKRELKRTEIDKVVATNYIRFEESKQDLKDFLDFENKIQEHLGNESLNLNQLSNAALEAMRIVKDRKEE